MGIWSSSWLDGKLKPIRFESIVTGGNWFVLFYEFTSEVLTGVYLLNSLSCINFSSKVELLLFLFCLPG